MCEVLRITLYFFEFAVKPKLLEGAADAKVIVTAHSLAAENEGSEKSFVIYLAVSTEHA